MTESILRSPSNRLKQDAGAPEWTIPSLGGIALARLTEKYGAGHDLIPAPVRRCHYITSERSAG
ncbi:hypothetical protein AtDm6_0744 [Acetobacter tropicalis]|uniref:Uncharacterized protein n=1 Tax=Acetobacter tropicalis TaxID=104102 RepID=A0A094YXW7_9PROT|nr:hypothetical protein AtDm6_0744 [Acetobacter tropicalis]